MPPRILRFRLRMMRYNPEVLHVPGKCQISADALSREFAASYGFVHTTSSPRYPRANGEVERAVRTVNGLLKKNDDPYLALLTYRSTPLQTGLSPSSLCSKRH